MKPPLAVAPIIDKAEFDRIAHLLLQHQFAVSNANVLLNAQLKNLGIDPERVPTAGTPELRAAYYLMFDTFPEFLMPQSADEKAMASWLQTRMAELTSSMPDALHDALAQISAEYSRKRSLMYTDVSGERTAMN